MLTESAPMKVIFRVPDDVVFNDLQIERDEEDLDDLLCRASVLDQVYAYSNLHRTCIKASVRGNNADIFALVCIHQATLRRGQSIDPEQALLLKGKAAPLESLFPCYAADAPLSALLVRSDEQILTAAEAQLDDDELCVRDEALVRTNSEAVFKQYGQTASFRIKPPWENAAITIVVPMSRTFAQLWIERDTTTGCFTFKQDVIQNALAISALLSSSRRVRTLTLESTYAVIMALYDLATRQGEEIPSEQHDFVARLQSKEVARMMLGAWVKTREDQPSP